MQMLRSPFFLRFVGGFLLGAGSLALFHPASAVPSSATQIHDAGVRR